MTWQAIPARPYSWDAAATSTRRNDNNGGSIAVEHDTMVPATVAAGAAGVRKVKRPIGVSKQEGRVRRHSVHQHTQTVFHFCG